jgi:hypothetical protein
LPDNPTAGRSALFGMVQRGGTVFAFVDGEIDWAGWIGAH